MRILIMFGLMLSCPVIAQTTRFQDSQGRTTGYAVREGNTTVYRDSQQRTITRETILPNGSSVLRNAQEQTVGRSQPVR